MQDDLVKLCPRCGSEYQLWVERCLDCGATLVHGREGQGFEAAMRPEGLAAEGPPTIPPDAILLRNAPPDWIGRLSEDLDEAGIGHWVSAPEWQKDPRLFVLPSERTAVPVVSIPPELADPGACPACGERLPDGAVECPGCGLMLSQPDACPNCGVELEPFVASCRQCGYELFGNAEG